MKGTSLLVIFMMLGIVVALLVGFSPRLNLFGGGEGSVEKTTLQSGIYSMGNSLDAAGLYLDASLDYSVFQACYDNLGSSGLSSPDQRKLSELQELDSGQFYMELEKTIEAYFRRYTNEGYHFMTEYNVLIPNFEITVIPNDLGFSVTADSESRMSVTSMADSGETITLWKSAIPSSQYSLPCFEIFLAGRRLNKDLVSPNFKTAFDNAVQVLLDSGTPCRDNEECTAQFSRALINPDYEDQDYIISSELAGSDVTVSSVRDGEQTTYTYTFRAEQEVTVAEKDPGPERFYPVWNGQAVSFEDMELAFLNVEEASRTVTV